MNDPARPAADLTQCINKGLTIPIIEINRLLAIAPTHYMINGSGVFYAWFPSHGLKVTTAPSDFSYIHVLTPMKSFTLFFFIIIYSI
jgi:hypothetical protein